MNSSGLCLTNRQSRIHHLMTSIPPSPISILYHLYSMVYSMYQRHQSIRWNLQPSKWRFQYWISYNLSSHQVCCLRILHKFHSRKYANTYADTKFRLHPFLHLTSFHDSRIQTTGTGKRCRNYVLRIFTCVSFCYRRSKNRNIGSRTFIGHFRRHSSLTLENFCDEKKSPQRRLHTSAS